MRITLRQLAALEAVAREGGIVKAAANLGLSHSAISMSLKDLEGHLGVDLFLKSGRNLKLTDMGKRVLEKARTILAQAADLETLTIPEQIHGRLRIGAAAPIGNYLLPSICAAFIERYPDVRIELRVMPSQFAIEGIYKSALDIAFVGAPVNSKHIEATPWLRDPLVVCSGPTHPLSQKRASDFSLEDLAREKWIMEKTHSSERTSFTLEALKYVNSLNIVLESDSVEAIKRAVQSGTGLACLSRLIVNQEIARGELVPLKVKELDFTRIFSLIVRRKNYETQALHAFRRFALDARPQ